MGKFIFCSPGDESSWFLQDLNHGKRPEEEEVLWVLRVADSKNKEVDDKISIDEIEAAIDTWVGYQRNIPLITDIFRRWAIQPENTLNGRKLMIAHF